MSELSKQALKVDNNQSFPNNNGGLITPAILRAFNTNMIDSMVDEISYNVDSASWNQQIDTLESTTASFNNSITQLNASSASQQISINALNSTTASLFGSSSLALYTASFNNGTRNLTFTKGDNQTFSVNIPDVSGSAGTFVTTSSFNAYTESVDSSISQLNASSASQQVSINNLNTTTASLLIETQNLELFSASALISISNLNASSASQQVSINALNTFTASQSTASLVTSIDNLNTFSASVLISISNLNNTTASLNTSVTNINQFTQSAQAEIDSLQAATASYANSASVATVDFNQQQQIDALIAVTGSFVTSSTNITSLNAFTASQYVSNSFFATTGSNTFVGNQTITGNITALSASFTYLQTIYESSSVIYSSGSNIFGDELSDVQTLSGSVKVQGSLTVNGTPVQTSSVDITALNQATASLQQATASLFTSASLGLTTASVTLNTITFTKGDGTTFPITVNTGSAGGAAFPFTGSAQISGSLGVTGSISSKAGGYATVVTLNGGQSNPGIDINGNGNTDYGLQFRNFQLSGGQGYEGQIQMYDKNRNRIVMMDTSGSVGGTQNQRFFIQQNNTSRVGINGYTGVQLGYSDTALSYPNQIFISSSVGDASDRNFIGFNANPSSYIGTYNYVFEAANPAQGGARTFIKGHLFVSQSFTASLQNGYAWVGNSTGYNTQVTTSSFATPIPTGTISGSQQITSLGFVSSSVTASSLVTASFDNGTRNLTFTKGDASTFAVNIPDVSGSTGNFATTGSNVFVGNQTISGSLFVSGSEVLTGTLSASALRVENNTHLDGQLRVTNDAQFDAHIIIQGADPHLKLRDTSGGGGSAGYDVRVNTGSFEIYDDTHNRNVLSDIFNSASAQHTTSLTSEIIVISGSTSVTLIGNVSASIISASTINGLGDPLAFSTSVDSRLDGLEAATSSYVTSAITASSLVTASFSGNTLTFTKGDASTFGVVIPDVSGSTINTGSFATTGSNAFFGTNTFSGAVAFTGSAPTILSSSFSGSIITNLTDTYTDVAAVNQIVTLTSASYAALASGSLTNPNTLYIVSGSTSGSITGATLGSNSFVGDQTITGSLILSSSNAIELQVIGNSVFTGSVAGNVVSASITSNTASIDFSLGNYFEVTSSVTPLHLNITNIGAGRTSTLIVSASASSSILFSPNVAQPSGSAYSGSLGSIDILSLVAFNTSKVNLVATKALV